MGRRRRGFIGEMLRGCGRGRSDSSRGFVWDRGGVVFNRQGRILPSFGYDDAIEMMDVGLFLLDNASSTAMRIVGAVQSSE